VPLPLVSSRQVKIHVTRIALRDRMAPLEGDADVAGEDAFRARASGKAGSLALGRRRGGARPNSPTMTRARSPTMTRASWCSNHDASKIANHDTSKLVLERTEGGVDVARSYASTRDALHVDNGKEGPWRWWAYRGVVGGATSTRWRSKRAAVGMSQ